MTFQVFNLGSKLPNINGAYVVSVKTQSHTTVYGLKQNKPMYYVYCSNIWMVSGFVSQPNMYSLVFAGGHSTTWYQIH